MSDLVAALREVSGWVPGHDRHRVAAWVYWLCEAGEESAADSLLTQLGNAAMPDHLLVSIFGGEVPRD